jgi:UDP-N-acetyl-D-glucosamine dehydrogenase
MAYKKNVEDLRESPSLEVLKLLLDAGSLVEYSDPHVPAIPKLRRGAFDLKSITLTAENLARYDAVIMLTDHKSFDHDLIRKHSNLLIDTRGAFPLGANVVKA